MRGRQKRALTGGKKGTKERGEGAEEAIMENTI